MSDNDKVICPNCVHEFAATPVAVQAELSASRQRVAELEERLRDTTAAKRIHMQKADEFYNKFNAATARAEAAERDAARYQTAFYLTLTYSWKNGFFGDDKTNADYMRVKDAILKWEAPSGVTVAQALDAALTAAGEKS